jgi:uncharacterized protein YhfF
MTHNDIEKIKFGGSLSEIDTLANKVLTGEKIATSSLFDLYLLGKKKQSKVGDIFSILNSVDKEVAIVEIQKIQIAKFRDITEKFAKEEGDGSLTNWLLIHKSYYSGQLSEIGKELNEETLLVCEWFKVVQIV